MERITVKSQVSVVLAAMWLAFASCAAAQDLPVGQSINALFFGELDYRHCEHCRSAFGPAAYLVGLLRFVKVHVTHPHRAPLNGAQPARVLPAGMSLDARRPDLFALKLDCNNEVKRRTTPRPTSTVRRT